MLFNNSKQISTLLFMLNQIKFKPKQTKPLVLTCVTSIPILIQSMSAVHINTNLQVIQTELNITSQQASWILNIETIMTIVFITLTSKLSERFGATKIMLSGTVINSFFNMLFVSKYLSEKYVAVLILRALAAAGIGLMVPSQMPVNVILVQTGKLPIAIALCSMMVPIGSIVGAMIAGIVAKSIGWYNMCTIIASIGIINSICQGIFLPFNLPSNTLAKINFLSFFLVACGVTGFLFGLVTLNDRSLVPLYASICILICGLAIICIFFAYDIRYAHVKLFSREIWNRTLIVSEIILLINCIVNYGERYFNSYQLGGNLKVRPSIVGVLLALTGISVFVFSPITNILQRKMVAKYCVRIYLCLYAAILLLNALSIKFFPGIGQYVFYTFLDLGFYVGVVIVCQSYNYAQTPLRFSQQIGGLNALMQALGQALGVALSVVIAKAMQGTADGEQKSGGSEIFSSGSISITLCVYIGLLVAAFGLSLFLGVFRFERGKKGFSETAFIKTKTFSDNKTNNADMVEVDAFEDGVSGNFKNHVIQYFSLYNVKETGIDHSASMNSQNAQEWNESGLDLGSSRKAGIEQEFESFKIEQKYNDVQF